METKNLVSALKDQENNLHVFLDTLMKQQKGLIGHDISLIDEAVQAEVRLLKAITTTDSEIVKTISQLSKQFELKTTYSKLLDFTKAIKKINTNDYVSLLQLQKSVRALLAKIQTINSQNSLLIENARNFIKQTFTSLAGVNNDPILDRRV